MNLHATVESQWWSSCAALAVSAEDGQRWWNRLGNLYGAPERHYHTLRHIGHMLQQLDQYRHAIPLERGCESALGLAAIFHDAVYDSRSQSNEEDSAIMAQAFLSEAKASSAIIDVIGRLILCTRKHTLDHSIEAISGLFLDCDLSILAAPPDEYDLYAKQIRLEYNQYDDQEYRAGRARVLESFVSRPKIFFTPQIAHQLEAHARSNLHRELLQLQPMR